MVLSIIIVVVFGPLTVIFLSSNVFKSKINVAVVHDFPEKEAKFILGNDLAGSQVKANSPVSL